LRLALAGAADTADAMAAKMVVVDRPLDHFLLLNGLETPVLLPGEVERMTRAERSSRGIPLDDKTIADLIDAAGSVGLDRESARAMLG